MGCRYPLSLIGAIAIPVRGASRGLVGHRSFIETTVVAWAIDRRTVIGGRRRRDEVNFRRPIMLPSMAPIPNPMSPAPTAER